MKPAARKLDVFRGDDRPFVVRLWQMIDGEREPLDVEGAEFELEFAGVTKKTSTGGLTLVTAPGVAELRASFSTTDTNRVSPDLGSTYSLVRTDGELGRRTLLTGSLRGIDAPLDGNTDVAIDLSVTDGETVIDVEVTDSGVLSSAILGEMEQLRDSASGFADNASGSAEAAAAAAAASAQLGTDMGVVIAPKDGTIQNAQIEAAVATFNALGSTADNASAPAPNARPLRFLAGNYRHSTGINITSPGVDTVIESSGPDARMRGMAFTLNKSRAQIRNTKVSGAPVGEIDKVGLTLTGDAARNRYVSNFVAEDKDIGILLEGTGAFDNLSDLLAFRSRVGLRITGNNFQINGSQVVGNTGGPWGLDMDGAQGCRLMNFRNGGGTYIRGSSSVICIENYLTGNSLTRGGVRSCGAITNVANSGGSPELTIATKIATSVAEHGPIFQGGDLDHRAEARITFSGSAGQVTSVLAGATELLSAPVPFNNAPSDPNVLPLHQTVADVAAAINAGSHGYLASSRAASLCVAAPKQSGFAVNGRTIAATATGGMSAAFNRFLKFTWGSAHGFTATNPEPQFFEFDAAPHIGIHVVRYVPSATEVVVETTLTASTSGLAWKPHCLIPEEAGATIANTGGVYDRKVRLKAITDTTVTLDMPFADLPTLPAGAYVGMPNWCVVIDPLDTNNQRVNDLFVTGGNINYLLILGGFNLIFNRTRLKRRVHIAKRANVSMQSEGVQLYRQGRGRAVNEIDVFQVPPVSGCDIGWVVEEYSPGALPGDGFRSVIMPLKGAPLINGKPQTSETRQYEDGRWERWVGSVRVSLIDAQKNASANPSVPPSFTLAQRPAASTALTGAVIWRADSDRINKLEICTGSAWISAAATEAGSLIITQTLVTLAAGVTQQLLAANTSRRYLAIVNRDTGLADLGFGGAVSAGQGWPLAPAAAPGDQGGGFLQEGSGVSTQAVHAISSNGTTLIVMEG